MNERQTLKQYSTYDNKITLQNVLDIIASYGGVEKADGRGSSNDCFGIEYILDDPDFNYDLTICFDGTVIESTLDANEVSENHTYIGLSVEDVLVLSKALDYDLVLYQGKLYSTSIDPTITDLDDNYVEFIQLEGRTVIVGTYKGIIISPEEFRKKIQEESKSWLIIDEVLLNHVFKNSFDYIEVKEQNDDGSFDSYYEL